MNHLATCYERTLAVFGDRYPRIERRLELLSRPASGEAAGPDASAGDRIIAGTIELFPEMSDPREMAALLWAANWLTVRQEKHPFNPPPVSDLSRLWGAIGSLFGRDPTEVMWTTMVTVCDAWHRVEGRKAYLPSEALARRLLATELRGLRTDDLRLPFRCIYVALPCDLGLRIRSPRSGWHPMEGAYLAELGEGPSRQWHILLWSSASAEPLRDCHHSFDLPLRPGWALDDILEECRAAYSHSGKEVWLDAFRFLMNVVIYATWPDAERDEVMLNTEARALWDRVQKLPRISAKRDRLKEELKRHDPVKRIILGRSVPKYESPGTGPGSELVKRVQVQGHWKQQPHGPALTLRKTIWVQPYWKGPEDGVFETPAEHRLV